MLSQRTVAEIDDNGRCASSVGQLPSPSRM
jgi:hypothetical protein